MVARVDPASRRRDAHARRVHDRVGTGAALYVGTRVFVWFASHWAPFRREVVQKYGEAAEVKLARFFVLSLALMAPAEELLWRGLFQGRLADAMPEGGAAAPPGSCM